MLSFSPLQSYLSTNEEIYFQKQASYWPESAFLEALLVWLPGLIGGFVLGIHFVGIAGGLSLLIFGLGFIWLRIKGWWGEVIVTDRQLIARRNPAREKRLQIPLSQIRVISTDPITDRGGEAQWVEIILQNGTHQTIGPIVDFSTFLYRLQDLSGAQLSADPEIT